MPVSAYPDSMTMREARDRYFAHNDFGEDGGYEDAWVDFKFGPIPFPIPNLPARRRAVKLHDLHHVLTGYDVDTLGELEIAGFEMGTGCGPFWVAWFLSLTGIAAGVLVAPRRTFAAFLRGRAARGLYTGEHERNYAALLERTVGDMRRQLLGAPRAATAADVALYAFYFVAGAVIGIPFLIVTVPIAPFGVVALRWKKRRDARESARSPA